MYFVTKASMKVHRSQCCKNRKKFNFEIHFFHRYFSLAKLDVVAIACVSVCLSVCVAAVGRVGVFVSLSVGGCGGTGEFVRGQNPPTQAGDHK